MAWSNCLPGSPPAVVLILTLLTGSVWCGSWQQSEDGRTVWARRGTSVVLMCGGGVYVNSSSNSNNSNSNNKNAPNVHQGFATATTAGSPSSYSSSSTMSLSSSLLSLKLQQQQQQHLWLRSSEMNYLPMVTWLHNRQVISDDRRIITPLGHLNITRVQRKSRGGDVGEYQCFITTHQGVLTAPPTTLYVASLSRNFEMIPKHNVTVREGGPVRLSCQIDSKPQANLSWTREHQPLPQNNRYTEPKAGVLQIDGALRTDAGIYRCQADNQVAGKSRHSSGIQVQVSDSQGFYAPLFFLSPTEAIQMRVGQDVTLECFASGYPKPSITWAYKANASDVHTEWKAVKLEPGKVEISGQGNLVLYSIGVKQGGSYQCTAANTNLANNQRANISQVIEVSVLVPPVILDPPQSKVIRIAETLRLNCTVGGNPKPRVTWYKNGEPFLISGRIRQIDNQLVYSNSITSDTGLYQCIVTNAAGYSMAWGHIYINSSKQNPDPPRDVEVKVLSSTDVLVQWKPAYSPSGVVQAYSIHFVESDGNEQEQQVVSQNTSCVLDMLKPHTNYSIQVRAYNEQASDPSETKMFTTGEDVPTSMPQVTLNATSPTTLLVKWKKLKPEEARGTITHYKIQWQRLNYHVYKVHEESGDVQEFLITNLHPGKKYEVRVLARTGVGYPREESNLPWMTIRMPKSNRKDLPLAPVVTSTIITPNQTKGVMLRVEWELPEDNKVEPDGFLLKYRREGELWTGPFNLPHSSESYTISDLALDWYEVQVKGFSKDGNGAATIHKVHTAPQLVGPNVAATVEKLEIDPKSPTSVHLSWKTLGHRSSESYFYIRYKRMDPTPQESHVTSKTEEVTITGLKPFSVYQFSVRIHTSENKYGSFSPPIETTTLEDVPSVPLNVEHHPVDASTISLSWEPPDTPNGEVDRYMVYYTRNASLPVSQWLSKEVDGEIQSTKLSGLVSNTNYWLRVCGCTSAGCGTLTEPLSSKISAILDEGPGEHSTKQLYLIFGLIGSLLLLLILALIVIYVIKIRHLSSQPRVLACNGNGHINGKRSGPSALRSQSGGGPVGESHEMEAYVPMLTRIPPDFVSAPLDTKGGYPDHRVNGFRHPMYNGIIKKERLNKSAVSGSQTLIQEEGQRLVEQPQASCCITEPDTSTGDQLAQEEEDEQGSGQEQHCEATVTPLGRSNNASLQNNQSYNHHNDSSHDWGVNDSTQVTNLSLTGSTGEGESISLGLPGGRGSMGGLQDTGTLSSRAPSAAAVTR
ncbi:protogenin B-like isoform X2 [Oratosquilla oratoria]|uniref:protogenin B-like isoform X2 n=1 Tax=Oratosquilla oratoria TaxID=337810 RepID=UPI003F75CFB8